MSQSIYHIEHQAQASTPLAKSALHIEVVVEVATEDDNSMSLTVSMTTRNFAVTDNAIGGCKVGLWMDDAEQASWLFETPQNPARGFAPYTQRNSTSVKTLATSLKFNRVKVKPYNVAFEADPLDLTQLFEIGGTIIVAALSIIFA